LNPPLAGFNVDTGNSRDIAKLINAIDCEIFEQISLRNISNVKKNFTWSTQLVKLINMYHRILEGKK